MSSLLRLAVSRAAQPNIKAKACAGSARREEGKRRRLQGIFLEDNREANRAARHGFDSFPEHAAGVVQ